MKDDKIKCVFDEYLSGGSYPKISLDNANNLIEEKKQKRKQRKKMMIAFASFACALVIVLSAFLIADSLTIKYYDIASLEETSTTYMTLKNNKKYSRYVTNFEKVENATNANIDYYIYYDGDKVSFIKLEINAITRYGAESATIYIEFTDDTHTCESFKNYYELENEGKIYNTEYKYNKEQVAGEWVSSAYFEYANAKYFVDIESPSSNALNKYLDIIF